MDYGEKLQWLMIQNINYIERVILDPNLLKCSSLFKSKSDIHIARLVLSNVRPSAYLI